MTKELSPRAKILLKRLHDPNNYYRFNAGSTAKTPAAMQELIDAGKVKIMGRVNVVVACYVPVDTKTFEYEKFPEYEE